VVDNLQLVWAILLVPALAPLLELTITWNKNLVLPEFLSGIELWAKTKEIELAQLTEYLIAFSDFGQFLTGLLVIAVLPAVCEELLFRGTIQPYIQRLTGSPHRAIWITAFVFSAIHLQFYGFVPRLLLGALFGYLYYWSGNLSIPILGHFVNNGITVVLSYLSQQGQPDLNPDNLPPAPLYVLVLSVVAGAAVLYRFYKRYYIPYQHL
jgi:membrane protease YdiL (CAAX protease family)